MIVAFVLMLLVPCVLALVSARKGKSTIPKNNQPPADLPGQNAHLALAARAQEARSIANRAAAQLREAIAAANSVHGDSVSLSNQVVAARSRAQLAERFAIAAEAAASLAASRAAIDRVKQAEARAEEARRLARQTASDLQSVRVAHTPRNPLLKAHTRSRPRSTAA